MFASANERARRSAYTGEQEPAAPNAALAMEASSMIFVDRVYWFLLRMLGRGTAAVVEAALRVDACVVADGAKFDRFSLLPTQLVAVRT